MLLHDIDNVQPKWPVHTSQIAGHDGRLLLDSGSSALAWDSSESNLQPTAPDDVAYTCSAAKA